MRWLALGGALVVAVACGANEAPRARVCVVDEAAGRALRALPSDFVDWWVAPGSQRVFTGQVSRADCGSLEGVAATSNHPWLTVELQPEEEAALRRMVLTVDAAQLEVREAGIDGYDEAIVTVTADALSAQTRVRVRVIELLEVHVGPEPGTCHGFGCDFVHSRHWEHNYLLYDALIEAAAAHANGGVRFFVHDHFGELATYNAGIELGPDTWLGAAPGVPASRILLLESHGDVVHLQGNRAHVERLTIGNRDNIDFSIAAAGSNSSVEDATHGHVIENVLLYDYDPVLAGENRHTRPFVIGADTVVRNNHIVGYFDGEIELRGATGSRIIGNTFVYYADPSSPWKAVGANAVTIANNVVVSLTRPQSHWIEADESSALTVVDNVVEGFERAVVDIDVGDNFVGEAEIESPRVPLFFSDSEQWTQSIGGEGESMDGRDLSGRLRLRAGAFQRTSERRLPRHELVRVGLDCGDQLCDVSAAEPDALQVALWSSWPGGTVELYPSPQPYGRAVISWGTTLRGMGDHPAETMLGLDLESVRLREVYYPVHAPLFVAPGSLDPIRVTNLSLLTDHAGLVHHATMQKSSHDRHVFERLIIVRDDPERIDPAIQLGHNAVVRDVLIDGSFDSCLAMGARQDPYYHGPLESASWVLNVTCRLGGYVDEWPEAAFWLGSARDALFANVVVDAPALGLFGAPEDHEGSRYPPAQFTARAITYRGIDSWYFGMSESGAFDVGDVVRVDDSATLLRADGKLEGTGIDAGVDPADPGAGLLQFALELGRSIDGVDRIGRAVDQGAYEQGN